MPYLSSQQLSAVVVFFNLGQLRVIFHEELQVLVRDVHVGVATLFTVLFDSLLAAGEGIP